MISDIVICAYTFSESKCKKCISLYRRQGRSSSQIFGGAKKIAKKGSIFFPIKKIWWGRRPN